jgi:D-3-phosphoglycerate dehydrogenase / 2-oxoglutarate reductase
LLQMPPRPKVLLTLPIHPLAETELETFSDVLRPPNSKAETLIAWAKDADAIIVRAQLPEQIFEQCPRLKVAVRHGTGMDMIPLEQAKKYGVTLANVPGVNAKSVCEYALWALIGARRKLFEVVHTRRLNEAQPWAWSRKFSDEGNEIDGSIIGIVGFGAVGQKLAEMLSASWNVDIRVYNRTPIKSHGKITNSSLDDLLEKCDSIVLALPLTEQTRHLISAEKLARIKQGALLVNVARGAIIDESALPYALEKGNLGFAVLDVFAQQPLEPDNPLWTNARVLVTPHVAGVSDESMRRMGLGAVQEVRKALALQA